MQFLWGKSPEVGKTENLKANMRCFFYRHKIGVSKLVKLKFRRRKPERPGLPEKYPKTFCHRN